MSEYKELAIALAKAQGAIEGAKKRSSNPAFRSRYADLASVWDACRDELTSNGLSVVQLVCDAPEGYVGLETILVHSSGQSLSGRFSMPVKDPKNAQAVGSAITYARRYALMALVGIAPEDDDGNAATSGNPKATKSAPSVDWSKYSDEAVAEFTAASQVDRRKLYIALKDSAMPDDVKSATLAKLEAIARGDK